MNDIHKDLAHGRWFTLSFFEQMANIGSEVERTINWKKKGNSEYANLSFERLLELLDLTIADSKNKNKLKELCRLREVLVDYLFGKNEYKSGELATKNYFYAFNYAARARKNH